MLRLILISGFILVANVGFCQVRDKCTIRLIDNYNNSVAFILEGSKGAVLNSDANGRIMLSKEQMEELSSEVFTVHFKDHMAYMLYRTNFYFKRGVDDDDQHLESNKLNVENLCSQKSGVFYLRFKDSRIDDN